MDVQQVERLIRRFQGKRVAVLGDLMLDRYVWGTASRISQEAPVPVVQVERESITLGGAGNVLRNLASLGAHAHAFGVVGDDAEAEVMVDLLENQSIATAGVLRDSARVTTEKTRIVAENQQVVRVDRERRQALDDVQGRQLVSLLRESGPYDALIVEDYAKGAVTSELLGELAAYAEAEQIPVGLDPHPGNAVLTANLTVITPNRSEALGMAGIYPTSATLPIEGDGSLNEAVQLLFQRHKPKWLLVTLGPHGMALYGRDTAPTHIHTRSREVFDVSGAGDTVIAAFMLAIASGASPTEAASFANHAAGVVVGKFGTAVVTPEEALQSIEDDDE